MNWEAVSAVTECWEHDSKATPGSEELLQTVKEKAGKNPNWSESLPWCQPDTDN